ncbi:MAG: hypothetical protein GXP31_06200 [Kiritimatiellaeota bacterium]|nr:hypothetical protein [Kiritimatiellota bacterium]
MDVAGSSYVTMLTRSFGLAWQWMVRVLFRPFQVRKWLVIGFASWLAGLASGGGGSGLNPSGLASGANKSGGSPMQEFARLQRHAVEAMQWVRGHLDIVVVAVVFGVLLLVVVGLLLLWVSSRGKLVFLDCVARNRAAIRVPWQELGDLGNSLFMWRLGFGMAAGIVLAAVGGIAVFLLFLARGDRSALIWTGVGAGLLLAILVVCLLVIAVFLDAFVVPLMYRYNLRTSAAWSYFLQLLRLHPGGFVLYLIATVLLGIGVAMGLMMLTLVTCCCAGALMALPYVGAVIVLPITVFFRSFSVYFLQQFHEDYRLIRDETASAEPEMQQAPAVEGGDHP